MIEARYVNIDNKQVPIEGEHNLLELVRKANIDLPTFCYHSELSVYGSCRLCMVEVEGRGLQPACSTPPENKMVVRTNTEQIRSMRKIIVELLLANHDQACPTCPKNNHCQLQSLASKLGIKKVRFKSTLRNEPLDTSSFSLVRDPNKCVLCGDCVRVCSEIQSVGAIDFAWRGSKSAVMPCFGKDLGSVECVYCGQCSRVCPTGALTPKSEVEDVWKQLDNPRRMVVAQIAPAVRVAVGEMFGLEPGATSTGQIVSALRAMGFDKVYDTSFTADLTVIEEGHEFIERINKGERIPQFTSCCPAWVKFAEQYYPELLGNLSSCRSPQQMFGALSKEMLSAQSGARREDIIVVSIMPCTAKKFEARRPEFEREGIRDVDYVITTQELCRMIEESGLRFDVLEPESFDLPFGFKTGAGVIFGASGGVSEAVLRFVGERITGVKSDNYEFNMVRGDGGLRQASLTLNGREFKLAIVSGLKNARELIEKIKSGAASYDFVEVMACPGGCVGGAGQPVYRDPHVKKMRARGLYDNDKMLQLHKSQDNPYLAEVYKNFLGEIGSSRAHGLLHTHYKTRKRIFDEGVTINESACEVKVEVDVCFGTGCFLKGAQGLLRSLLEYIIKNDLGDKIEVKASFCFERCDRGPVVKVGGETIEHCTFEKVRERVEKAL
ncbi:MAG: NADH-dependent [FeFe] hydrogenase, group A6 [Candidatus Omnitrophica bacterium]|nr:NADH-dependent [FeFe] hydrogenase, group A6 [Candidatus Omnitrophota bacterium]MDD5042483.1 NADH-dependent [FeFe] hydrogenase, group A6 [Candidatus Omnitrophota bacterium]MDD5500908.1 NADH-dependent [FeFe] hydrogenase, group A6 [Candidatus Omnitrophota bacterium]